MIAALHPLTNGLNFLRFPALLFGQSNGNNATAVIVHLLKKLNLPVTVSTIRKTIEEHPDYPSILSISDSLKKWKIDNVALEIDAHKLDELPTPFIAHTKKAGGFFQLVTSVNGAVEFINTKGKKEQQTKEAFLKEWSGVVLLAEGSEISGEKDHAQKKRKELLQNARIPFIILACFLLCAGFFFSTFQPFNFSTFLLTLLLILKLTGCIITGLLLWFEIDKSNPVLKQFCTAGKNTNCSAVLSSKSSKLFNFISWSEIGFFYFAGSFIFLLSIVNSQLSTTSLLSSVNSHLSTLAWLNLLALPYTIFSIFYQWRIAKHWCPLCLAVQVLLIAEFIFFYFGRLSPCLCRSMR